MDQRERIGSHSPQGSFGMPSIEVSVGLNQLAGLRLRLQGRVYLRALTLDEAWALSKDTVENSFSVPAGLLT